MLAELRTYLLDSTDVTDLIGTRVDPFNLSEGGTGSLPAVFYQVESDEQLVGMGTLTLNVAEVTYTAFSTTLAASESVSEKVEQRLNGATGISGVNAIKFISRERTTVEPFDGGDDYFYSTTSTFQVWHTTS